jgi:threonine dehydratase
MWDDDPNPFVRFRRLTQAWHTAIGIGMSDDGFIALVRRLAPPFRATPLRWEPSPGVWVKDETANVAGSHRARHLTGLMIALRVAEESDPELARRPLATCGNAAIAAATVAHAARRALEVFVPADADGRLVDELEDLGAYVTPTDDDGFHKAVAAGALPFTCENGIEGGATLGWEIVAQLGAAGVTLDRLVLPAGDDALASALLLAFDNAQAVGLIDRVPRFDTIGEPPRDNESVAVLFTR